MEERENLERSKWRTKEMNPNSLGDSLPDMNIDNRPLRECNQGSLLGNKPLSFRDTLLRRPDTLPTTGVTENHLSANHTTGPDSDYEDANGVEHHIRLTEVKRSDIAFEPPGVIHS